MLLDIENQNDSGDDTVLAIDSSAAIVHFGSCIDHILYDMVPLSRALEQRLESYRDVMRAFFFS